MSHSQGKQVWMEKIQGAIDVLLATSPHLKDSRSEIKVPQVSSFYKHFTIPIEEILAEAEAEKSVGKDADSEDDEEQPPLSPTSPTSGEPVVQRRPQKGPAPSPLQRLSSWMKPTGTTLQRSKTTASTQKSQPRKIERTGSVDHRAQLERRSTMENESGAKDADKSPLSEHGRSRSQPEIRDGSLELVEEEEVEPDRGATTPSIAIPSPTKPSATTENDAVISPRYALLSNLPLPPPPPSDLSNLIKQTTLDPKVTEEITSKRASVTLLVNPVDGQPYRLKQLPENPQQKPSMPKKRSSVGQSLAFFFFFFFFFF